MLRRTENSFFAEAVDTERYNRFATVWPHSDFTVVYPERLPFIKEAIMNYDGIPADKREELQRAAKSASRWAFVQVGFRAREGVSMFLNHTLIKIPGRYGSHSRRSSATPSRSVTRRL